MGRRSRASLLHGRGPAGRRRGEVVTGATNGTSRRIRAAVRSRCGPSAGHDSLAKVRENNGPWAFSTVAVVASVGRRSPAFLLDGGLDAGLRPLAFGAPGAPLPAARGPPGVDAGGGAGDRAGAVAAA